VKNHLRDIDINNEKQFHNDIFKDTSKRDISVGKFYILQNAILKQFHKEINKLVSNGVTIIEIGCGLNDTLFLSLNNCQNRYGIDISEVAIEEQKNKAKNIGINITFFVMDAHKLDFEDATFDLVFGKSILHHLNLEKALPEFWRILKPNGKLIFIEPLGVNPLINIFRKKTPELRTVDEKPFDLNDLRLIRSVYSTVNFIFFDLLTLALPILFGNKINEHLISAFRKLDSFLFTVLPFFKYYSWQVLIVAAK
jgi:SAM-dependent methyltransferase